MADKIKVHDKYFELVITEEQITSRIAEIVVELEREVKGKNPLFLCVLNGAFMFAADILKRVPEPCEISFVKYASYNGANSSGKVKHLIGINETLKDRVVVVIEDIVDTGLTMSGMLEDLAKEGVARVIIVSLLQKPEALKVDLNIDFVGFKISNDFVVGYGLDYSGRGRNLPGIYKLVE